MLNLTSGQRINQFDVRLAYGNTSSLKANSVDFSNNLFSSLTGTPVLVCIDGIIKENTNCGPDDGLGTVHVIETALGGPVSGPFSSLLFNINFTVKNPGSSSLTIDFAHLFNPGPDLQNPRITYVPEISLGGIFSDMGIAPFYNYWPINPPALLLRSDVVFDASPSFDFNGNPIVNYVWSWKDGTPDNSTTSNFIHHRFPLAGNFSVRLTAVTNGGNASLTETVAVQPALGSLYLTILDQRGSQIRNTALVQIFNYTSAPKPFENRTSDFGGHVIFDGLLRGTYYLKFSGPNIENNSTTENVSPGIQSLDTVYLKVDEPSTPGSPYLGDIIFGVSMAAGIGAFGGALYWKRRSDARSRQGKLPVRTGKAKSKVKSRNALDRARSLRAI